MIVYKLSLKSETTGEIVATLRGSETPDRETAEENTTRHNDDLDHLPDYCHYVVVEVPNKPTGTFRCLTCDAIVQPIPPTDKEGDAND